MNVNFVATWKPETKKLYKKADAQKVAEEIYDLGERPEPKEVIQMARDERTETHKLIEWDDKKAAEKFRVEQVRHIMSNLLIVEVKMPQKEEPEKIKVPMRMFYNLEGETGYRPTPIILQSTDLHKKLLYTAWKELGEFVRKYNFLEELYPIFEAIRNMKPPE